MECRSESCAFRHATKAGNGEDDGTHHTCPPETRFGWKPAGGAKYLRLKYQDNTDNDPQKIRATEKSRGNKISYIESYRTS